MTEPVQKKLREALDFATKAHKGQKRLANDDPFITHPIAVMTMVVATEADSFHSLDLLDCMIVALLHDVIEDTDHDKESLLDAGFGQWEADVSVLSRRKPQDCELCAPQWDETHRVSDECFAKPPSVACQTHWDYIKDIRRYAIAKAKRRTTPRDWRHETVIRVKRADIAHNMETAIEAHGPGMLARYEKSLEILLSDERTT